MNGCIPVALNNSEGAGSVRIVVRLPGAHLYMQVLGNEITKRLRAGPSHFPGFQKAPKQGRRTAARTVRRRISALAIRAALRYLAGLRKTPGEP